MSISSQMQKAREMLGVETNAEVLPAIQALQQPQSQPVIMAVTWTPGTPELGASISVLSGEAPIQILSATLRAGLAVLDANMAQRAAQLQQMLQQERARKEGPDDPEIQ